MNQKKWVYWSTIIMVAATITTPVVAIAETLSSSDVSEEQTAVFESSSELLESATATSKEQAAPRVFFKQSRMTAHQNEPLNILVLADQEVEAIQVEFPKEATVLLDSLPTGVSATEVEDTTWLFTSTVGRSTFSIPVVFESAGEYTLTAENEAEATVTVEEEIIEESETQPESDSSPEPEEDLQEEAQPERELPEKESGEEGVTEEKVVDEEPEIETAVFDGDVADVGTAQELQAAIADEAIGTINLTANITISTANTTLGLARSVQIQGNGHTLTLGNNTAFFQLNEVPEEATFRLENMTLTKTGANPFMTSSVVNSANWTLELEDIQEVNANTMRLAVIPEGRVLFTGGTSTFTRTQSTTTFIESKEIHALNEAQVTISRGNASVFFSSATVSNPKLTVQEGAAINVTTTSGVANTIDFRGENPAITLQQNGQLTVATVGTTATPTNTSNNTIAMTGGSPVLTLTNESALTVTTTAGKRGIHLVGADAQLAVNNSELSVTSATQATVNINGAHAAFSSENSTIQLTSTTGQRLNLIGETPLLSLSNTEMTMNASTGRGVYLEGSTPQVLLEASQVVMSDTNASQGMMLNGEDALLSLSNQSDFDLTGAGTGTTENIQIGNNNARPELSVTGGSKLSVTTTSGTGAASNTTNNAINIRGRDAQLNVIDSTLNVNIRSGARRALLVRGDSSVGEISDSKINIDTLNSGGMEFIGDMPNVKIRGARTDVIINSTISANGFSGNVYLGGVDNTSPGKNAELEIAENATVELNGRDFASLMINSTDAKISVTSEASLVVSGRNNDGVNAPVRFRAGNGYIFNINNGGHFSAEKENGTAPVIRMSGSNNRISVIDGGLFEVHNPGDGTANDGGIAGGNQGIYYPAATDIGPNTFEVGGKGSAIFIDAKSGPGIDLEGNVRGQVIGSDGGYLSVSGRTATANGGIFSANNLMVDFDNPLFMDFRNNRPGGGNIFNVNNTSELHALNSDLAVWRNGSNLDGDPDINFPTLDYSFTGTNFNTLGTTNRPEILNTDTFGTTGLTAYSRMSSNNARWAIADELHQPTNADKKIYGRVSLPVGLDDTRPAWDDEAIVTVEIEHQDGTTTDYQAHTVGHSNEDPGISIYGQEPRGGLFEVVLDDFLQAGDKVRIKDVALASGELSQGFEHQILTDTLEVFPIIPPTPAEFSSEMIPPNANQIQGRTDNPEVEVTATHNGNPIDTSGVTVDSEGIFTLPLGDVTLEEDDEIQVFLRDTEGSAEAAGVINPPVTNNTRGNINPTNPLDFHDATFAPATILTVSTTETGPFPPVDPIDPDQEVDPENPPVIPGEQGQISIDFASQLNFGEAAIGAGQQSYDALPQRLLNADGTINEEVERPNYVQISDRRSSNDRGGWSLSATLSTQGFRNAADEVLTGAQVALTNQQLATTTSNASEEPHIVRADTVFLRPGVGTRLLDANAIEGSGTWIYRFGDQESAGSSVQLDVPAGANPKATAYQATINWELSSVPGND